MIKNLEKNTTYNNINVIAIDINENRKKSSNSIQETTPNLPDGLVDYWPLYNSLSNLISTGAGSLQVEKGSQPTYTSDGAYLNNIVLSTQNNYTMPSQFSIVFQIKPTQINSWSFVVGKKLSMVNNNTVCGIYTRYDGNVNFVATSFYYHHRNYDLVIHKNEDLYTINQQHTVAMTQSNDLLSLYVDGNFIGSTSIQNHSNDFNGKFYVGGSQLSGEDAGSGVTEGYSPGYYKNVMVFNKALTQQEIQNLGL